MSLVALEKVEDYSRDEVRRGLERVLSHLGGMGAFVSPGDRVLLKPNMLYGKEAEAAVTTHPAVVAAVIELVRGAGGIPVVGDSPGFGRLSRVAEKCGIMEVLRETGTELVEFTEPREVRGDGVFRRFELAGPYLDADRVINLPKLKTHGMMTMTCAVKNLFGAVVGTAKAGWHMKAGEDREMFARMLLELYQLRKPDLNIVDAIVAMEGDGPGSGDPRRVGLLIAGTDAVAVDLIAAEILRLPKKLLHVERAARALGMPGADRDNVVTAGCSPDGARVNDFRLPAEFDVQWGLPRFITRRIRDLCNAFPDPIPGKCGLCGICRDACPPKAIEIRDGAVRIDRRRCIRCFCCRELCPSHALGIREGTLLKLIKKYA